MNSKAELLYQAGLITLDEAEAMTEQTYRIIDTKDGRQVGGSYKNRARARSRADKLDNEYGAVRYRVAAN